MFAKPRDDRSAIAGIAPAVPWGSIGASISYLPWSSRVCEIWWTRSAGRAAIDAARRSRLAALVRFARAHSPFYRDAYRGLPARGSTRPTCRS